ncbi:MAG TPA: NAD(P)H-hydrate dehydratase [Bacteroidota bacterium]|nr:NAD(P)H-hydrate dehydratase [Bacteroidota bacterium]
MQVLVTADQMQQCDRIAITKYAIPGLLLMENAGRACVEELTRRYGSVESRQVVVFCGKGNNGGDGFVVARHLLNLGARVYVALLCRKSEVKGDAKTNLQVLLKLLKDRQPDLAMQEISASLTRLPTPDIVVDAIFGTGFSGSVRGMQERAIRWINAKGKYTVAVDIPSGANATTGAVEGICVNANLTVTMGLAKVGQYVGACRDHTGDLVPVDIGIPRRAFASIASPAARILADDVKSVLPKRSLTAHKHSVGKIFILAGSRGLTGAPIMCAQGAMRSGAGAVVLGVPRSIHGALVRKATEVMMTPLEETSEGTIAAAALKVINERVEWADVVVIGPGLSVNKETGQLIRDIVSRIHKPIVIDADGLTAIAEQPSLLKRRRIPAVLTPHVGELSRLIGKPTKEIETLRVQIGRSSAQQLKSIVVLKGSPTVTATPSGSTYLNSTGNPGMATAGAGDVLAGVIAAFIGQGMTPEDAAYSGVFVHGLAGDMASEQLGQRSVMAMDIADALSGALSRSEGA